jgi:DNA-binding GntR family transcriptional regulator
VYQRLRDEIVGGALAPGQRLVELDIARRMRTSQGPVREALVRLRAEGLILSLPHTGSFVSEISMEEARDAYQVRAMLERHALKLALPRMTQDAFTELERETQAMTRAVRRRRLAENIAHDMSFHRRIYEWAGSPTLLQLWDVLEVKIRKFAVVATVPLFRHDPLRGANSHYALLAKMKAGYSPDLEAELDHHLAMIWLTTEDLMEGNRVSSPVTPGGAAVDGGNSRSRRVSQSSAPPNT